MASVSSISFGGVLPVAEVDATMTKKHNVESADVHICERELDWKTIDTPI